MNQHKKKEGFKAKRNSQIIVIKNLFIDIYIYIYVSSNAQAKHKLNSKSNSKQSNSKIIYN